MELMVPWYDLVEKIQEAYKFKPNLQQIYQNVLRCPKEHPGFKIVKGILLYNDKKFISEWSPRKQVLLQEDLEMLLEEYPNLHLEEKVFVEGKRDVMTQNNDEAEDQTEAKSYGSDFITSLTLENRPKYFRDYDYSVKDRLK
ncbi:unnamed protein product [Sphenostylis stenocarpa]|uniref:Uncharacterized protein n=1 Tax=Sphenostylis stenocarpa TaxID=92480 RepID=A0AA86SIV5_9FABA|nr:unnamed protein product [Sphenostylis stenocarpa]